MSDLEVCKKISNLIAEVETLKKLNYKAKKENYNLKAQNNKFKSENKKHLDLIIKLNGLTMRAINGE